MKREFLCGHCNKGYPLVIGSGFPLVFVTQDVKDSMSPDCIPYFKEWYDWGAKHFWGYDYKLKCPDFIYKFGEGVYGHS